MSVDHTSTSQGYWSTTCLHFPGNQSYISGILVQFGKTAMENHEFGLDSEFQQAAP